MILKFRAIPSNTQVAYYPTRMKRGFRDGHLPREGMIGDVRVLVLLALAQAGLLAADQRVTAADVVELVSTSLYSDHDEERLAQQLHRLKMSEQLSPHIVVYFRSLGLGAPTVAALQKLQEQSIVLAPPPEAPLSIPARAHPGRATDAATTPVPVCPFLRTKLVRLSHIGSGLLRSPYRCHYEADDPSGSSAASLSHPGEQYSDRLQHGYSWVTSLHIAGKGAGVFAN